MKNNDLRKTVSFQKISESTRFRLAHAVFAVLFLCLSLALFIGMKNAVTAEKTDEPIPLSQSLEIKLPPAADKRLYRLAETPDAYAAFILGSFPAYGYDTDTLSGYLNAPVYQLAADNIAKTEEIFDFVTQYLHPTYLLFSVAACDFLQDSTLKSAFTTQNPATGGVARGFEDIARIGDAAAYAYAYAERFAPQSAESQTAKAGYSADALLALVRKMNRVCTEKGIRLVVVLSPVYDSLMNDGLRVCYTAVRKELASTVECYDFSESTLCADKRYFYNQNEFRTSFGDMILAELFKDSDTLGVPKTASEKALPILLYHHVTKETGYGDSVISRDRLEEHFRAIADAGYTTVSLKQAADYVLRGTPLPENPICITFDDGYESGATLVLPLLQKYQMKATIFYIGWAVGKDLYKDTGKPMFAHFDFPTARAMHGTGLVEFGSHTYDMHQSDALETGEAVRVAAQPLGGEAPSAFAAALKRDCECFGAEFQKEFGEPVRFFSYPHGSYSKLSEKILADQGYTVTLSTEYTGKNVLVPGLAQSLRALYRFTVGEGLTGKDVLALINAVYAAQDENLSA